MKLRGNGRSVTRLEGFSDAVFAFAATLLVVSLEVPSTFSELSRELYGFVSFGVSFAALVLIWSIHNSFFRRFGLQDGRTVFLNSVLLFVVLFYVYPLKFVAGGIVQSIVGVRSASAAPLVANLDELGSLFAVYSAGFVVLFLCFALMYAHAYTTRQRLGLTDSEAYTARMYFRHFMLFVAVGAVSLLLALFGVGVGFALPGWVYFALGPACAVHGVMSDRWRPKHGDA